MPQLEHSFMYHWLQIWFSKSTYILLILQFNDILQTNYYQDLIKEFNEIIERNYDERINGDEKTFLLEATGK